MNKIITLVVAFLLFIPFASINGSNVASNTSTNNILYVGGSGPDNYTLVGIEQNGEKPVIDGGGRSFAINITADGCIVKQFKIINYGDPSNLYIGNGLNAFSDYNTIDNNRIECSSTAIFMSNASLNTVTNNTITNTGGIGICMVS